MQSCIFCVVLCALNIMYFYDLSDNIWKSIKLYCDGGPSIFKWCSAGTFQLCFFYESLSFDFLCTVDTNNLHLVFSVNSLIFHISVTVLAEWLKSDSFLVFWTREKNRIWRLWN